MKLNLVSTHGVVLKTYYVGDVEDYLFNEDIDYLIPTTYLQRHPRGAALDLGKKVLKDTKELVSQGYK